MKNIIYSAVFIFAVILLVGCSKAKNPKQEKPDYSKVSFSNATEVVTASEIKKYRKTKVVKADFNMDKLEDLAVMHEYGDNATEVSIFLQKPRRTKSDDVSYFKAGAIRPGDGGKIVGVASKKTGKYTDLILLVAYSEQENRMICYKNNGTGFNEVSQIGNVVLGENDMPSDIKKKSE